MKKDPAVLASFEYHRFIEDLKARIAAARVSAARHVNRDMILLYWDIGKAIVEKQKTFGWGDAVVEMAARDLKAAFPGSTGFFPSKRVADAPVLPGSYRCAISRTVCERIDPKGRSAT